MSFGGAERKRPLSLFSFFTFPPLLCVRERDRWAAIRYDPEWQLHLLLLVILSVFGTEDQQEREREREGKKKERMMDGMGLHPATHQVAMNK